MVADSPTLAARLRELHDQREEALATALAAAAPDHAPAITPRAAAAALIAAADRLLFRRIQERGRVYNQSFFLNTTYRLVHTTAISTTANGYPPAQCSSGMVSKFMP